MISGPTDSGLPENQEATRRQARQIHERVDRRVAFFGHFTWYVILNLIFATVNLWLTPETWWFLVIAGGWGIFLVIHVIQLFVLGDLHGPFRDRSIREEWGRSRGDAP